ncbi:MAG: Asp-tRNA(Asn)/Glu-tRNA(Gln) amidotransferase subunit GatC [Bacteroidota bacterium]
MKINNETVDRIAELAKLEFEADAKNEICNDLNRIIGFIEKLDEIDTTSVAPLIFMNEEKNILREDIQQVSIKQDEALKNAPDKDSDYFKVPKVLNKG